ncbi:DUF6586 family protein [Microbulbifer thermotolerans]|uniref:Uncharacterized protein n=1 Tax=Microbulbifer thermotolerans TaxID=252514 RepID=A0A143HLP2_MICTH|nr:DUF6586 family protein [Microbulbifer thermotolerans]AMX02645.1 hypothetical protein A3224_08665 [Microbulbifer thermotolerans]MCX2779798.1 hypothetical protein [Microbulbifer thermotolerans]MCX2782270.1 hypothetical protein [Microbulbifer thermotolerans]MCX2794466.1 hypothetical protein [Microbulbifer thermotolerans]MCX2805031.1 hypothetical protein [Microbulbifer thermotolerans]
MSNPYTGIVASSLRKAALLLETENAAPLARTALYEAVVLQLWRAYRAFLAELAFQLQLMTEPESAQTLAECAQAAGKTCSQAVELQELLANRNSWLAQMQAAWRQLWHFSQEKCGDRPQGDNLIPVQDISASAAPVLNDSLLWEWHGALGELVQRQRAQAEEW